MDRKPMTTRTLPVFLFTACLIPTGAGLYRLGEIIAHHRWSFDFLAERVDGLPLFLHVTGAVLFLTLGAFQVWPSFRAGHHRFHRIAGRIAAVCGFVGAGSGLWMTFAHPGISSGLLYTGRIGAALFWLAALTLGIRAVLRGDMAGHRAWMTRAYAIALPAGTLAFILLPLVVAVGEEGHEMLFETIQVLAWPAHLAVAEWLIRRRPRETARCPRAQMTPA